MMKSKYLKNIEQIKEEKEVTELINKVEHSEPKKHGHKMGCKGAPTSIKGILELLINQEVIIVLESGEREKVEVEAVIGNLLAASIECENHKYDKHKSDRHKIKFIDICCICEVLANCEEVLEGLLGIRCGKCRKWDDED